MKRLILAGLLLAAPAHAQQSQESIVRGLASELEAQRNRALQLSIQAADLSAQVETLKAENAKLKPAEKEKETPK